MRTASIGIIFLVLFTPLISKAQTGCDETIRLVDSTIRAVLEKEYGQVERKTDSTQSTEDDLKFEVDFFFEISGTITDVKVKKIKCKKCTNEEIDSIPKRIVELISGIQKIKPCSQKLHFKLPVVYKFLE